jgi:hypothetical protein
LIRAGAHRIVLAAFVLASLVAAADARLAYFAWVFVTPNPCQGGTPYDVSYRFWNRTSSATTVSGITDGSDIDVNVEVPANSVRTVHSAHGSSASVGAWVHNPVFRTSAGSVYAPEYTFRVSSDEPGYGPEDKLGWVAVAPNPCSAGSPYDVYYLFWNNSSRPVTVSSIDDGSTIDIGSTVEANTVTVLHSAHGSSACSGEWVHNPSFATSAGAVYGPRYVFSVH